MADSLRDLVVSISLRTDNFAKNIKTLNRQIKEFESEFKLADTGVKGFENTAAGASAKLSMLYRNMERQQQVVNQYNKALANATVTLRDSKFNYDKYEAKLKDVEKQYGKNSDEYKKAEQQLEREQNAMQKAQDEVSKLTAAYNESVATLRSYGNAIKALPWEVASARLESFSKKLGSLSTVLNSVGRTMTTTLTAPIAALGAASVKASMDFESTFASVRKTVEATEPEFKRLAQASKEMSTQVASGTSEINEVMATGGQLGIANDHLVEFTRTMIDLGNSCEDLDANTAATELAKLANIMNTDQGEFHRMGSAVVELGNNFATTEGPIVEMAERIAGAGKQVGLSESQILGFAAGLSSVGIQAQMGGTALSKALINMQLAVENGGTSLKDFAKVSGMTSKEFVAAWKADPAKAFMAFIDGVAKMDDEGISAIKTLSDLGIKEVRLRDTLLRTTNASELFTRAINMSDKAWKEDAALTEEANKRYATTESQLTNLKNKALLFGQQLGDDLNPTIRSLIDSAGELVEKLMDMDGASRMSMMKTAGIVALIGPASLGLSKVFGGVSKVTKGIAGFAKAVGDADGGFKGFMSVIGKSPTTWILATAAIAAATVAIADYASGAAAARKAMKGLNETADEWKYNNVDTFYGSSNGLGAFGLSEADINADKDIIKTWVDDTIALWHDGQKETDEIIDERIQSFKSLGIKTKEALAGMAQDETASSADVTQYENDLKLLEDADAQIEALLKKRQNRNLTKDEEKQLASLFDQKHAIVLKYKLEPDTTSSYTDLAQEYENALAKARLQGSGSDAALAKANEDMLVAAAQGYASLAKTRDEDYNARRNEIMAIDDQKERETALAKLDLDYMNARREAAFEYMAILKKPVTAVWSSDEMQKTKGQIEELLPLLTEYSLAGSDKTEVGGKISALVEGMDESQMTEFMALLTQIQSLKDAGVSDFDINEIFGFDANALLGNIGAITDFVDKYAGEGATSLEGLASMFGESLSDNMIEITTDLNMDNARARWEAFAKDPGALIVPDMDRNGLEEVDIDATIKKYTPTVFAKASLIAAAKTEAEVTGYDTTNTPDVPAPHTQVVLDSYDETAYNKYKEEHPLAAIPVKVSADELQEAYAEGNLLSYIGIDGIELPITPEVAEQLTSDMFVVKDENGKFTVLLTPKIEGTDESVEKALDELTGGEGLETRADFDNTWWHGLPHSAAGKLRGFVTAVRDGTMLTPYAEPGKENARPYGLNLFNIAQNAAEREVNANFKAEDQLAIQTALGELVAKALSGAALSVEEADFVNDVAELMADLDFGDIATAFRGSIVDAAIEGGLAGLTEEDFQDTIDRLLDGKLTISLDPDSVTFASTRPGRIGDITSEEPIPVKAPMELTPTDVAVMGIADGSFQNLKAANDYLNSPAGRGNTTIKNDYTQNSNVTVGMYGTIIREEADIDKLAAAIQRRLVNGASTQLYAAGAKMNLAKDR